MNPMKYGTFLFATIALAVITVGCAQEGEVRSGLVSVTGPSAIVQNAGGNEGCSPGYWKKKSWAGTGFTQGQTLESVFNVPDSLGLDNVTLLEALETGGGGVEAFLRHAVAALLNAADPNVFYPLELDPANPTGEIIAVVNTALALNDAADIESRKNQLDEWNNLHAPGFCD